MCGPPKVLFLVPRHAYSRIFLPSCAHSLSSSISSASSMSSGTAPGGGGSGGGGAGAAGCTGGVPRLRLRLRAAQHSRCMLRTGAHEGHLPLGTQPNPPFLRSRRRRGLHTRLLPNLPRSRHSRLLHKWSQARPPLLRSRHGRGCLLRRQGLLFGERCGMLFVQPPEGGWLGPAIQPCSKDAHDADGRVDVALPQGTEAFSGFTEPYPIAAQHRRTCACEQAATQSHSHRTRQGLSLVLRYTSMQVWADTAPCIIISLNSSGAHASAPVSSIPCMGW